MFFRFIAFILLLKEVVIHTNSKFVQIGRALKQIQCTQIFLLDEAFKH